MVFGGAATAEDARPRQLMQLQRCGCAASLRLQDRLRLRSASGVNFCVFDVWAIPASAECGLHHPLSVFSARKLLWS